MVTKKNIHRCPKCRAMIVHRECVLCDGYRPTERETRGVRALVFEASDNAGGIRIIDTSAFKGVLK